MKTKGRPKFSGNKYISISQLLETFPKNFCVPISSSFIDKYNLLGEKINTKLAEVKIEIPKSQVQIREINLNEE